jgi:hypothetical protein
MRLYHKFFTASAWRSCTNQFNLDTKRTCGFNNSFFNKPNSPGLFETNISNNAKLTNFSVQQGNIEAILLPQTFAPKHHNS